MAPRYTINGVQQTERTKISSFDSLEDYPRLKQLFLITVTFFIVMQLVLTNTTPPSLHSNLSDTERALSYIFPCLAVVICYLSFSSLFDKRKSNPRVAKMQIYLKFFAASLLVSYLIIFCPDRSDPMSSREGPTPWIDSHAALSEPLYIVMIFLVLCPTFILKTVVIVFYYVMVCALYVEINNPAFWWLLLREICSCGLIVTLLGISSGFESRRFEKAAELEEWNKVYTDILDRNPSYIAVVDVKCKLVYSNTGFQELAQKDPKGFFQSVTNLKSRDYFNNSFNFGGAFNFNTNMLSPLSPISSEESLVRRQNSLNNNKKNISRLSTKVRMNTINHFVNLWQVLTYHAGRMEKEALDKDLQLTFDGKSTGKFPISEPPRTKDTGKELGTTERETRRISFHQPVTATYEITIRPCTEYKKLIVIMNNTTERDLLIGLENNSEYKDKVLASVSHELRTPLNGTLGCLQAALNDKTIPEPAKTTLLVPAFRSGKLLSHVIDDITDYSQMQGKGIKLNLEMKSLSDTLNYCIELFDQSFKSKGLKLRLKMADDLPKAFRTDHKRLKQILLNLLSNALKFTQQGGVTLRAACLKGYGGDNVKDQRVEIKVEDTGMGIKPHSIQKLFGEKVWNQGVGFKEINSKGAGLGLKITQKLAELLSDEHSGEAAIQVTSTYGKGSCFHFTIKEIHEELSSEELCDSIDKEKEQVQEENQISIDSMVESVMSQGEVPLEHLNEDETILQEPGKEYFKIKRPLKHQVSRTSTLFERRRTICTDRGIIGQKVLIVDDDPLNIMVLESFMNQYGLQKDSAHNGKEALEKVMGSPEAYKLILMDCQMPIMDGFETTRLLNRKMEEGEIPTVPIVGCTAFSSKDKLKECMRSGMKEVLPKPVMKDQIGDVLKRYLGVGIR